MDDMKLEIKDITKEYKDKTAVNGVNLILAPGVYGLLGSNGAGKTTLMRMMADVLRPTRGQIYFNGENIALLNGDYRKYIGYLPQDFGYYPSFTAKELLLYIAALKGMNGGAAKARVLELLEAVGLEKAAQKKIKSFSGGMKQRVGIAQALLNDPKVLILDEPTAGLDPKERVRFRNMISGFGKDKIVLLSTHIVSDVEYISREILIMKEGRIIRKGRREDILNFIKGSVWEVLVTDGNAERIFKSGVIVNIKNEGDTEKIRLISEKKPDENAVLAKPSLEDVYMYYFGEENEIC